MDKTKQIMEKVEQWAEDSMYGDIYDLREAIDEIIGENRPITGFQTLGWIQRDFTVRKKDGALFQWVEPETGGSIILVNGNQVFWSVNKDHGLEYINAIKEDRKPTFDWSKG